MSANSYLPSKIRFDADSNPYRQSRFDGIDSFNTGSFFYDSHNAPLKSTQQIKIDWSKFENHSFFMPAEIKVNLAFEQIINKFPFDGSKEEVENFLDSLTGYDRWLFDNFPKHSGSLHFSGSYIEVVDSAGFLFKELAKNKSGDSILNPPDETVPLTIELKLFIPNEPNQNSIICQKKSSDNMGISLHLLSSATDTAMVQFSVVSGSNVITSNAEVEKGKFNNVCAILSRNDGSSKIKMFVNSDLKTSSKDEKISYLDIQQSSFFIASGTNIQTEGGLFSPVTMLSGTIDELRIFHSERSVKAQSLYANKNIFSMNDLKLYYKFNEPANLSEPSTSAINSIVLDSSGNSLHSYVTNFTSSLRVPGAVLYENSIMCPNLFPGHNDVIEFNENLLQSASAYDKENPNIITRLVPPHFLLEGAENDGFGMNVEGDAAQQYTGNGIPGTAKLGSQQIMLSFLYIWAKFFDEIKLYVDQFSNLTYVDYDENDTIPDNFLDQYLKNYGINLSSIFSDSTIEQYVNAENITNGVSSSEFSLKDIKNQLMRRVIVSLPGILNSKGTQHSIKSFLRAFGIEPDNTVRIREYGGPVKGNLNFSRDNRTKVGSMLSFSEDSYVYSPFLSGSRVEPGFPNIAGTFVSDGAGDFYSNNPNDGLFTSGSWTFEGLYRFIGTENEQNLASLLLTGSTTPHQFNWLTLASEPRDNILSGTKLNLTFKTKPTGTKFQLTLDMSGSGIFDGDKWYVSFGRKRNDEIDSIVSSSFFLRAAKQNLGNITKYYQTSSFFDDSDGVQESLTTYNESGSFILIGNYDVPNDTNFINSDYSRLNFDGLVSNVRFWSRGLTELEAKEHTRNPFSFGADFPSYEYNYVTTATGSFGKLRIDAIQKQDETTASGSSGNLRLLDFSSNELHFLGKNFLTSSTSLKAEVFNFSHVSPYFDLPSSNVKVRVRGLDNEELINPGEVWIKSAPSFSIARQEEIRDNNKFSVDFSLVDSLNRDIINMFSSFDSLNNCLGSPNNMFNSDYPELETFRDVYFNRLSSPIDFVKFFEFYRWFDRSVSLFIDQLIPKRTAFKGVNFVVEQHALERGKLQYYFTENYSLDKAKKNPAGSIPESISYIGDNGGVVKKF